MYPQFVTVYFLVSSEIPTEQHENFVQRHETVVRSQKYKQKTNDQRNGFRRSRWFIEPPKGTKQTKLQIWKQTKNTL